jgi:hypothetical protein
MTNTEERLVAIGFGSELVEPVRWRITRIDLPTKPTEQPRPDPACSAALLVWRDVMRLEAPSVHYRVSRI